MAPRFVIVGTGRSGSGYIAAVLTAAGIPCGHEAWWTCFGVGGSDVAGDSSCCALPWGLRGYRGLVLHQVRHPLAVVTSMIRDPLGEPHRALFARLAGGDPADRLGFAMRVWLGFGRAADRMGVPWWRVDDVDADLVSLIGAWAGMPVDAAAVAAALAAVPRDFNRHYSDRTTALGWDDLDTHDPDLTYDIREQAARYGYH